MKFVVWLIGSILCLVVALLPILGSYGLWILANPSTEAGRVVLIIALLLCTLPVSIVVWLVCIALWAAWSAAIVDSRL